LVAPFVVYFALPFFRKIDVTSAYEYLEKRFNTLVRLLASSLFVFFQIGRMAIVMYLPSLALATITPLSVESCILVIGVLSILYCTMGGLEAVIWTDAMQAIILLGGALLSFVLIVLNIEDGMSGFFEIASSSEKFNIANWDWDVRSVTRSAFWVVLLGGIAQAIIPGTSDQAIIQRYMSVDSEAKARKAIWTNAIISMPGTVLFFALGTALFVFYKSHPARLDPNFQIDAVFPLFIANELPVGIAGLAVAGIFAAAQSTISTSMNSTSTAIVTDFAQRYNWLKSEKGYLNLARLLTVTLGILGTSIALIMANANIISLWDTFMKVIGLFGGPLCGVFLLGMLSKRANTNGVITGLITGVVAVAFVQAATNVSYLLHAAVGISSCMIAGYFASLIFIKSTLKG
jgi:SSS family transporter